MLNRIKMVYAGYASRIRQAKQDYKAFIKFVSVPATLSTTGIKLPSNINLYAQTDIATNAPGPVEAFKVNGTRPIFLKVPANTMQDIGRFSAHLVVTKTTVGVPGNVKLYIRNGVGVYKLVAQ